MSKDKGGVQRLTKIRRWDMRKEMLSSWLQGFTLSSIIDAIVTRYHVKRATVYQDWLRRKRWIPQLLHLDNAKEQTKQLLLDMRETRLRGWDVYRQALKNKNEGAAIAALKHMRETLTKKVEVLQSLGVLAKTPEKLDAMITTAGPMPWEQIPEVQKALERMREKLKAEKAAGANVTATT